MEHPCPRCQTPLDETEMLGTDILRCPQECGLIVEQRCMLPFTDALAKELAACLDLDEDLPAVSPDPRPTTCPGCSGSMKNFGYMETRFVYLDRCAECAVLWIDRDELDQVVRLAGKNLRQVDRQAGERRELHRHLTQLVWVTHMTHAAANRVNR